MGNQTALTKLFLSGLSDLPSLQLPLFLFFVLIYLLTLTWNLLIIILIVTDSHLHTPMYFFLGNLASLDICFSSVTIPRMLFDLLTKSRLINATACFAQVFFFIFIACSEVFLLVVMSCDRYVAICRPLHYTQIMLWRVCVQLMSLVWVLSLAYSLAHLFCALKVTFCNSNVLESFFCDLPQLFQISCSNIHICVLFIFFLEFILAVISLTLTFLPYVYILRTIFKMQVKGSRSKVFSTCSSHLTVVVIFYGSLMFNYLRPKAGKHLAGDKVVSVFYTVIPPLLNPLIYSLRNQDFIKAFQDVIISVTRRIINSKRSI
ncbi:olfactory receptor 8G17-like [Gastrophryne carolinensis]